MTKVDEWKRRRSSELQFVNKTDANLRRLEQALDGKKTILDMVHNNDLTPEEVVHIQKILEINGYSKSDMFHLPYSFVNRILGIGEGG